jgi:hypothetical protein
MKSSAGSSSPPIGVERRVPRGGLVVQIVADRLIDLFAELAGVGEHSSKRKAPLKARNSPCPNAGNQF